MKQLGMTTVEFVVEYDKACEFSCILRKQPMAGGFAEADLWELGNMTERKTYLNLPVGVKAGSTDVAKSELRSKTSYYALCRASNFNPGDGLTYYQPVSDAWANKLAFQTLPLDNNDLAGISVTNCQLAPAFSAEVPLYICLVNSGHTGSCIAGATLPEMMMSTLRCRMVLSTGEESPWRATECDTV